MLLFAKLCTCYNVWFWFGQPSLKIPWVLCKTCLLFENLRIIDWKSYFWEIWVQYKCFWRAFHLIFMHFIHKILCFEEFLHKIAFFSKNCVFQIFDWSKIRFDRSKIPSIDPKPIKQQSKWSGLNQNFNRIFDWSKNMFDRSKIWKDIIFWKTKQFYAKTPQSIVFYKSNAWVWDKMLFKNTCIEPRFPKNKIFNQLSLNSQTANMFCIKFKEFSNLVGQTKITHYNMYKV